MAMGAYGNRARYLEEVDKAFQVNGRGVVTPVPRKGPKRPGFMSPKARNFDAGTAMERMQSNPNFQRNVADESNPVRSLRTATGAGGPKAPAKLRAQLSGADYGETLSRLGRATRRQKREFSATVHPLSGRVMDMRRGTSGSVGMGAASAMYGRKSTERMAALHARTKNPAIKERINRNMGRQNPAIKGPDPVLVHNHPSFGPGKHNNRSHPSGQDLQSAGAMPKGFRHVVLSHNKNAPVGQRTKAVTTRVTDEYKAADSMGDLSTHDFATQSGSLQRKIFGKDPVMARAMQRERVRALKETPGRIPGQNPKSRGRLLTHDEYVAARTGTRRASEASGFHTKTTLHKSMPKFVMFRGSRCRVLDCDAAGKITILGKDDQKYITHMDRVTPVKAKRSKAAPVQQTLPFKKSEPLRTAMSERDAKRAVARVGLAGELPKNLTREQRMGAYEARYVASGGRKGEKWQRRTERADKVKTGGLAVATAGGAAFLGTKAPGLRGAAARISPKVRSAADTAAIGGAVAGGAGELYGGYSRRKRASYASAPGGVAASALRRMRAMDAAKGNR